MSDSINQFALPAKTVLNGRYIVEQVLGQGGFGITYKAQEYGTNRTVAIKEYFPDVLVTRENGRTVVPYSGEKSEEFLYGMQCFLEEAQTLSTFIGMKNIVQVYAFFEENNTAYYVMDYVEGETLQEYRKRQGGTLTFDEIRQLIFPIMDALAAVHEKGIIHRDVTPDNIYVMPDKEVKLLDFGAARYSLGDRSQSLDIVLKHGYAPVEQYSRHGRQGPYTDIYSLAATVYELLTGRIPPDSVERVKEDEIILPSMLGAKISQQAEDALMQALAVQAQNRFQNMAAFKAALSAENPQKDTSLQIIGGKDKKRTRRIIRKCAVYVVSFILFATLCKVLFGIEVMIGREGISKRQYIVEEEFVAYIAGGEAEIVKYNGDAEIVEIPAQMGGVNVKKIGYAAFESNSNIKSVVIPDSVTKIGNSAFCSCTELELITFSGTLVEIDDYAFSDCVNLEKIILPEKLEIIGSFAFNDCSKLQSIELPDGLLVIEDGAFANCSALTQVMIPDSVYRIGELAFMSCSSLKTASLSANLTTIERGVFAGCVSLTDIYIPDSVTYVESVALGSCDSLTAVSVPTDGVLSAYALSGSDNAVVEVRTGE